MALVCAIGGCMPVHDVTLGADLRRMAVADDGGMGEPGPADATVGLPETEPLDAGSDAGSVDAGSAPDPLADAAPREAAPRDAAPDSASVDAARGDAGGQVSPTDDGDAGEPHDDDTRAP